MTSQTAYKEDRIKVIKKKTNCQLCHAKVAKDIGFVFRIYFLISRIEQSLKLSNLEFTIPITLRATLQNEIMASFGDLSLHFSDAILLIMKRSISRNLFDIMPVLGLYRLPSRGRGGGGIMWRRNPIVT